MPTIMTEPGDSQRPRILRLYNLYRVVLGVCLAILTSTSARDGLLQLSSPQIYEVASWIYLLVNVLIAVLLNRRSRDVHLFVVSLLDIFLLGIIFYAAGGASSGFGSLLIIPVAIGNILLHGRVGLLLAALASLAVIYLTFFLSLSYPGVSQGYLQVGVLGCIYFAVAMFVQRFSRRLRQSETLALHQAATLANLEKVNQLIIQRMRTGIIVVGVSNNVLLANEAAAQLLGEPIIRGMDIEELAVGLAQRLHQWEENPSTRALPFHNHSGGAEIMANFKPLAADGEETVLVFLDDNSQIAQQAQQLKLASLGRLTASIAHEIRNPLGAISHAAQLLGESELLPPADRRLSEIIQQHSKRMNKVIETVLELSRRRPSEPQLVDLALWVSQFVADFSVSSSVADNLELEVTQPGIETRIDPNQLSQVVDNLCRNALRYSGPAEEHRTIWLRVYIQPDTDLPVLEVIDHGPGIAEEHITHIFEPFYTTEASGTGLGLYISRELCESNQARLEYEPMVPRGSCMRITFAHPKRLV
ncbi:MAG: two-component system sensor histidine kinase PilS (NtrC family) [Halopseudomonas sp.]|jgi:two-component system sensor histidine kinase PilS (NtrC family)|uniref:two-component system sensor histidine kinase NtrB n=1 Tax=Halopseudomonas sp. TaxID=2901191 RepID=UPI0039E43384